MFDTVRVSLLDRSRTRAGEPDAAALTGSVARARWAEELGYHRFWVAEHHAVPGIASGSPAVLMAAVAARTERIRVGSGGVMLPNHRPLVVAEQFLMLDALYPGRIDLGIGRSLGFVPAVRRALGREPDPAGAPDSFPGELADLLAYLDGTAVLTARPAAERSVPVFILATGRGLGYAARAGLPVVVGGPALAAIRDAGTGDAADFARALDDYRAEFRPSARHPEPYVALSLDVLVAETTGAARELLLPEAWAMAVSRTSGAFPALESVEHVLAQSATPRQREVMDRTFASSVYGDAGRVAAELAALFAATGADELIASSSTHDRAALRRSDAALAGLFAQASRVTSPRP